MSVRLRVGMILLALFFIVFVFHTVNRKKLQMRYSLLWFVIAIAMMVVAIFPQIAAWAAALMGIQTPVNLIYLLGIFAVLTLSFSLAVHLSKQADNTKRAVQMISIERYLRERQEEEHAKVLKEEH